MNRSVSTSPATISRSVRLPRRARYLVGVLGILVALSVAYVAYAAMRMNYVPPNLDYSTTRQSTAGLYRVGYAFDGPAIPVNKLHTWTLHVETSDGQPLDSAGITVDGDMPQHGHGMPTRPLVTQNLGNGDYLVEGMKFQMGGWWVIDFTITAEGQTDTVSFNLMLQQ